MLFFLLDCLRSSKLLEILRSIWCNSNNLLDRKTIQRKKSIVCVPLNIIKIFFLGNFFK